MSTGPISVVLADDHTMVRSGLRMVLEAEDDLEVTSEAADVKGAIRKLMAHRPNVLVLDINMAGESSLDSLPELREASPDTAIVVLTMQTETEYAREALQAGARGYLLKEAADSELVEAIRTVAAGRNYVQPAIGARLASEPPRDWPPDGLTEREAEVLRLIALGHTNKEVGDELFLSVRTVESHRAHIQQKLGLQTRAELVRYALDRALIGDAGRG
jgi:two-component system, NarL family, response regulator NreC